MTGLLGSLDLPIGQPLPRDLIDKSGRVLMTRGTIIESVEKQRDLVERGVSYSEHLSMPGGSTPRAQTASKRFTEANPFERIADVADQLEELCCGDEPVTGFDAKVNNLASVISNTCDADADAALASVVLTRHDSYAIKHQVDVAILAAVVGLKLDLTQRDRLSILCAALTMNISMLEYQDWLHRQTSKLTEDETCVIQKHPLEAVTILAQARVKDILWLQTVATHHENPDGTGYPRGALLGGSLPVGGQILRTADMYTARISARAFNSAESANATLADIMTMGRNQSLHQGVTEAFIRALGFFPPGCFVRLSCGEIGMVVRRGKTLNQPVVFSLVAATGTLLGVPVRRDTSIDRYSVTSLVPQKEVQVKIDIANLWGYGR